MRRGEEGFIDWFAGINWGRLDQLTNEQLDQLDGVQPVPEPCLCRPTWRCQLHTLP